MGGGYKEDPADKAARRRERRITDIARQKSSEEMASGLTSDIRAVYGMKGLVPMQGMPKVKAPASKGTGTQGAERSRLSDNTHSQWGY